MLLIKPLNIRKYVGEYDLMALQQGRREGSVWVQYLAPLSPLNEYLKHSPINAL